MSNEIVVKHNEFVEGRYNLTLTQVKIIAKLSSVVKKDDEDFKLYKFQAKDLIEELQLGKNNYDDLKKAVNGLVDTTMQFKKEKSNLAVTVLSSAEYFESGLIELEFSPKMKPYLLKLQENFTKYELEYVLNFSSFYAVRIYELCKQYEKLKERTLDLEELKEILQVQKKYDRYSNFKAKVLLIAEREINIKADINISYIEKKIGKKVTAIKFLIEKKEKIVIEKEISEYHRDVIELFNLLPEFEKIEIRKEQLNQHLKQHSFEMLKEDILYCCEKNIEKDFWGYFESSLKHGHYSKAEIEKKKLKEKKELEKNKQEIELKNMKTEFEKYFSNYCMEIFLNLNNYEKSDYEKVYNVSPVKKRVSFEKFTFEKIKEHFQNEIDDVCNPDDFKEQKSFLEHIKKVRNMRPEF